MQSAPRYLPAGVAALALALLNPGYPALSAPADETPREDAYASVWESLSELMRRREYGTAAVFLESLPDDPTFRGDTAQVEADRRAIAGLQTLEQIVHAQASNLPKGARLDIYGIEYSLLKYDRTPKGDELVLQSQTSEKEYRKPVSTLPSAVWLQLSESKLEAVPHPSLILGIFVGFDRTPDVKAARKLLNEAAMTGADVTLWVTRLDEAAKRRVTDDTGKKDKEEPDPFVGRWRMSVKDSAVVFDLEIRANGTNVAALRSVRLDDRRRRRRFPPRLPTSVNGKWTKDENGMYRFTLPNGVTAEVRCVGDRLIGRNAAGDPVLGLRQVVK